jgi:hypothetical protein
MRNSRYAILVAGGLVGCTTNSTGILPAGPNTYTVTEVVAPIQGGGASAQQKALVEANAFCQQPGRVFVPNTMNQAGNLANPYGPTGYAVTFQCLAQSDRRSELQVRARAKYHHRAANSLTGERLRCAWHTCRSLSDD